MAPRAHRNGKGYAWSPKCSLGWGLVCSLWPTLRIFMQTAELATSQTKTSRSLSSPWTRPQPSLLVPREAPLPSPVRRGGRSGSLPLAQASHPPHLLVAVLMGPFPFLLLICLLFLLLWEDVVNPGQIMLGEDEVQKPSNNDEAQNLW